MVATEVRKRFGQTQALAGVSIAIKPGTVHVLVGRNGSGKSTLVSVLTGLQAPDTGRVEFGGRSAPPTGRRTEWRRLVTCVYQHSLLVPQLTVAENLFMGDPRRSALFSKKETGLMAATLLEDWSLDIDGNVAVADLAANERQLIEIVRATRGGTRLLIMDEPTTRLARNEVEQLFAAIRRIRDRGGAVLFISHYLQEAFEIGDTLTVLRDGRIVAEMDPKAETEEDVVRAMVGRELPRVSGTDPQADAITEGESLLLEVRDLAVGSVDGVSFNMRRGECVGLAGMNNSGNRLVADTLGGLARARGGVVTLGGTPFRPRSVGDAIRAGVAFVPADRGYNGTVQTLSIEDNITMAAWSATSRVGVITPSTRRRLAAQLIADVGVAGGAPGQAVSTLSGGNQQKVVVGRAIATKPKVLILVEPTSGVDIASREAIFATIRRALAEGVTVLVVSERPEELVLCGRVLVMFRGRLTCEFGSNRTEHELVGAMEGVGLRGSP